MDFGPFEDDLRKALELLPPGLIDFQAVAERIFKHRKELDEAVPMMIEILKPHFMAAMMEGGMGILDKEALEASALKTLMKMGVNLHGANG